MKKKVLAMLMAACMVMGMTACGSSDGGTKENAADVTGKTENTASESEGDAKAATPEVTLKLGILWQKHWWHIRQCRNLQILYMKKPMGQ